MLLKGHIQFFIYLLIFNLHLKPKNENKGSIFISIMLTLDEVYDQ